MKKVVKKSVKKYDNGGNTGTSKTRTVTKSPDGMYKTVTKGTSANTRRTIKGVISGAPKPMEDIVVTPRNYGNFMKDIQPQDPYKYNKQPKQKKGGSVKRKTK